MENLQQLQYSNRGNEGMCKYYGKVTILRHKTDRFITLYALATKSGELAITIIL